MKALHLRRERACTEHEATMLSLGELGHILVPLEQTGGEMERKVEARCWLTRRLTLDAYTGVYTEELYNIVVTKSILCNCGEQTFDYYNRPGN